MPRQGKTEWTTGLDCLRWYIKTVGDSRVPLDYVTKDGFKLGSWVSYLRTAYNAGELSGKAVIAIEKVPRWGWSLWKITSEKKWLAALHHLRLYVKEKGTSDVPVGYVDNEGFYLGAWVRKQRILRKQGELSKKHKHLLSNLPGWTWAASKKDRLTKRWLSAIYRLRLYVKVNGTSYLPVGYRDKDGFYLGAWISRQRHQHKMGELSKKQQQSLGKLPGWTWAAPKRMDAERWFTAFGVLQQYIRQKGHCDAPQSYTTSDGFRLGTWVMMQRHFHKKGRLLPEHKRLLESLPGWHWELKKSQWLDNISCLKEYVRRYGNGNVPKNYVTKNGFKLGAWVSTQRYFSNTGQLQKWKRNLLGKIPGWKWKGKRGIRDDGKSIKNGFITYNSAPKGLCLKQKTLKKLHR